MIRGDRPLHVVFAGHVDHGKTTLIGRLLTETGSLPEDRIAETLRAARDLASDNELTFITDQLEEERRLNITLDTCQIPFRTRKRAFIIIDAPGHLALVKNMLTGASAAEAAVLIVSAPDGILEQTRRHAFVLGFLGIRTILVVLNKMDLVHYDPAVYARIQTETEDLVRRAGSTMAACVPVSARTGQNVVRRAAETPWYKGPTVIEALEAIRVPAAAKKKNDAILPIQDVYSLDGERIAVGRVVSGTFRCGQRLFLEPGGRAATLGKIRLFGSAPDSAATGENIGILLAEPDIAPVRGQALAASPSALESADELDARIFWIGPEPLLPGTPLLWKCCTQEVPCRVTRIFERTDSATLETSRDTSSELLPNESGEVRIQMDRKVWLGRGGGSELERFALEKNGLLQGCGYPRRSKC